MENCIFCKLANHDIPTDIVYENELATAFKDTDPKAPVHVLVVPKRHVANFSELTQEDGALMLALTDAVQQVVQLTGIADSGYRLVVNTGDEGGQTVMHLHIHVFGGRQMTWPAG